MSKEEWPEERYPPWAHGAGYVLSADLGAQVASGAAGCGQPVGCGRAVCGVWAEGCHVREGGREGGRGNSLPPHFTHLHSHSHTSRNSPHDAPAGTAYAASEGGHLFKLEDIALGGWLEWLAAERGIEVQRIKDKRWVGGWPRHSTCICVYICLLPWPPTNAAPHRRCAPTPAPPPRPPSRTPPLPQVQLCWLQRRRPRVPLHQAAAAPVHVGGQGQLPALLAAAARHTRTRVSLGAALQTRSM